MAPHASETLIGHLPIVKHWNVSDLADGSLLQGMPRGFDLISTCLSGLDTESPAWEAIHRGLPKQDEDQDFWWTISGRQMAKLMHEAGYSLHLQKQCLLFHYHNIVPRMGPRPPLSGLPSFKSYMCDDYTPIEYSWRWEANQPCVRYAVELIGPQAGTPADPHNEVVLHDLFHQLETDLIGCDMTLYWKFGPWFQPQATDIQKPLEYDTYTGVGFEFQPLRGLAVKAYYVVRSETRAEEFFSRGFSEVWRDIHGDVSQDAFDCLRDFRIDQGKEMHMGLFAVDCVDPRAARVKVYLRTSGTSFNHVINVMTLGGRKPMASDVRDEIKDLWYDTLGLGDEISGDNGFASKAHCTAGTLFHFDIKPGSKFPDVKCYIPLRHYCHSENSIVNGLANFMNKRGRGQHMEAFKRALKALATEDDLEKTVGVQTYVTFSVSKKGGGLDLSSYLNPHLFGTLNRRQQS